MINIQILKTSPRKFRIACFEDKKLIKPVINLDFNPLVNTIEKGLKEPLSYCLAHWRPKPIGLEQFGVYDASTDRYYSMSPHAFRSECPSQFIEVKGLKTKPSACILYLGKLQLLDVTGKTNYLVK